MKSIAMMVLVLTVMSARLAWSGDPCIGRYRIGDISKDAAQRANEGVAGNLLPVQDGGVLSVKAPMTWDKGIEAGKAKVGSNVMAVVILAEKVDGDAARHVLAKDKVVVVAVDRLKPANADTADGKELWLRRVEKECVGGAAFVLGMPACQLIYCALYPAPTLQELDQKARGLCPPCVGKWESMRAQANRSQTVDHRLRDTLGPSVTP